jgi:hypothetical protein
VGADHEHEVAAAQHEELTVAQERQVTDLVAITPQQRALWVNGLKQVCACGFV